MQPQLNLMENAGLARDDRVDANLSFVNVVDDRVLPLEKNLYPIYKTNTSVTTVAVPATNWDGAVLSINTPNLTPEFYIDRNVYIKGTLNLNVTVQSTTDGTTPRSVRNANTTQPLQNGVNVSTCALPFNECITTSVININDSTVSTNYTQESKDLLLRLSNYRKNMNLRACPSALD